MNVWRSWGGNCWTRKHSTGNALVYRVKLWFVFACVWTIHNLQIAVTIVFNFWRRWCVLLLFSWRSILIIRCHQFHLKATGWLLFIEITAVGLFIHKQFQRLLDCIFSEGVGNGFLHFMGRRLIGLLLEDDERGFGGFAHSGEDLLWFSFEVMCGLHFDSNN